MTLVKPSPLMTPQVGGVARRLSAAGFAVEVTERGAFTAVRPARRGLIAVMRYSEPPLQLWVLFAGWPARTATLAELRLWLDTFGAAR